MSIVCAKRIGNNYQKHKTIGGAIIKLIASNSTTAEPKKGTLNKPTKNYHVDAFDAFTNVLIQEKTNKWKTSTLFNKCKTEIKADILSESSNQTNNLVIYLKKCLENNVKVEERTLRKYLIIFSKYGCINGLITIEKLYNMYNYSIEESNLRIHYAEAYWVNGDILKMLEVFEWFYPTHSFKITCILDPIVYCIVKSKGGASVVLISKFVFSIAHKYGDFYPMCVLWKNFFMSELFDDNLEAEKLLKKNSKLIDSIQYVVPIITRDLLRIDKIDHIYQLMTLMLKHNQTKSYQWILRNLFDYYYVKHNVKQCTEIMKHSLEINVPLTDLQHSQLINMLLHNKKFQHINKDVTATIFKLMF
ncbi:uncharacterized protein LOC126895420 [Daktulosphaira vitifoliae]|uniref:uncharacterized protein LOC126895420 n=1 Tax=Daktulosphaira vitifoliae TaxID=58002 RepID=UPI0021A9870B|nr:uncharacterized protein LOC126895420 [Daktulosphaira vitifoliae]